MAPGKTMGRCHESRPTYVFFAKIVLAKIVLVKIVLAKVFLVEVFIAEICPDAARMSYRP
jgi:hypothetical protein